MSFTFVRSDHPDHRRYTVSHAGRTLSRGEVLQRLASEVGFVDAWIDTLRSAWDGYNVETPPVHRGTTHRPFELALLPSDLLARTVADPTDFLEHFGDGPVAVFSNLGRNATLIAPTPVAGADSGHIAAFTRTAPHDRQLALWRMVGQTALAELNDAPLWLSTAGLGVPWLHVRLDRIPKYYRTREWKDPVA